MTPGADGYTVLRRLLIFLLCFVVGAFLMIIAEAVNTDQSLYAIQANAKVRKSGLWADPNPVPPWIIRSSTKAK